MRLRSGAAIRSGRVSSNQGGSIPSTQASSTGTHLREPSTNNQTISDSDTSSESSMSTQTGNNEKSAEHIGLDYNTQLRFEGINNYEAKIYKDNQGRYLVKIEDHPSNHEQVLMANYQGDRYMAPSGVMYLVVEDPDNVGPLGEPIGKPEEETSPEDVEEQAPTTNLEEFTVLNSFQVKRVPIDDEARALYTHWDGKDRTFYGGLHPRPYSLTPDKTLYTFYPKRVKVMSVLIFLDKFRNGLK